MPEHRSAMSSMTPSDAGHGHADNTPGSRPTTNFQLGLDGRNVAWYRMLPSAPLRAARALLRARASKVVGTGIADGLPPVLRPRLRRLLGSGEGCDDSSLAIPPFLQLTLEIRGSVYPARPPFNPFAQSDRAL